MTAPVRVPPGYTTAQYTELAGMKDDSYELGVARAEFVNKVLLADGTVSDDWQPLKDAVAADEPKAAELDAMIAENRFLIIANARNVPVIYFQCAVPGNPDLPPKKAKGKK